MSGRPSECEPGAATVAMVGGGLLRLGIVAQLVRYGVSGAAAVGVHLLVPVLLVELTPVPSAFASAVGFACAVPVNYGLQHSFVFNRRDLQHAFYFPRYVMATLLTMALNTGIFWFLADVLGVFYVASQVMTTGVIVPLNFVINRQFTFGEGAAR